MRRPMSPKRHAGPRTVLSSHSPMNAARSAIVRVEHVDRRPPVGQLVARLGHVPEHPTGRDRQVLPHRRRLGEQRRRAARRRPAWRRDSSASSTTIGRPAGGVGVERGAARRRAARGPCAGPSGRRRTSTATGPVWRRDAITRAVLATASARSAARPSQNMRVGGPRRHRRHEVDLRQRGDESPAPARPAPSTHTSLARRGRRPARVVARGQHPAVAAGHHGDAVGSGDGVQPDDDVGRADLPVAERRHGRQRRRPSASGRSRSVVPVRPATALGPVRRQRRDPRATPDPWPLASTTPPSRRRQQRARARRSVFVALTSIGSTTASARRR